MRKLLTGVARFALSAWVGAAALFVVVGIKEVREREFDSMIRDLLVGLRFPPYYAFGFALVGVSWLALTVSFLLGGKNRRKDFWLSGLLTIVLAAMLADYYYVYSPLLGMITPPGQTRPAAFVDYHETSKWLNFGTISLTAMVALILCCSERPKDERNSNSP